MEIQKSYKPKEVASIIGCSTESVYRLIKYNQIEAYKPTGRRNYRITENALRTFIERMKVRNQEINGQD